MESIRSVKSLLFILLFMSPVAWALTPEEIREAIHAMASERHPSPTRDFWERLGPEALPVLKQMLSESISPVERTWVIEGLAHFSDPGVAQVLESEIKRSSNGVFKKKMLSSLIQSQGDSAYDFAEPYLSDRNPHIRIAVARSMTRHMSASKATERLKRFQSEEKESWVKIEALKPLDGNSGVLKRSHQLSMLNEPEKKPLPPLPEKAWVGEWKGVYVNPLRTGAAKVILTRKGDQTWSAQLKLPKHTAIELQAGDLEVVHYTSNHQYWIELRNRKEDSVFLGSRKPK
jgi:hypothetical protein